MILLEKRVDDRGHLPSKATDDLFTPNESMRPVIRSALAREQTFVDLLPFGIPLNSSPDAPVTWSISSAELHEE